MECSGTIPIEHHGTSWKVIEHDRRLWKMMEPSGTTPWNLMELGKNRRECNRMS
jgi:hypothetical protein